MKIRTFIICLSVLLFRILDLFTTQIGIKNFEKEEQNLLVKLTGMNIKTFFILETIFALLLVACYLLYVKNKSLFFIKASNLKEYFNLYLFDKKKSIIKDWFTYFDFKKALVLFGSSVPFFVITTSILFSLNNYWASLFNQNNPTAIKYYLLFNDYYFFDFIIFVFPVLLLVFLLIRRMRIEFRKNSTKEFNDVCKMV